MRFDLVAMENNLAYQMLEKAVHSDETKSALLDVSNALISHLFEPYREALKQVKEFKELPPFLQTLLRHMTIELGSDQRQYASLIDIPADDILSSVENTNRFLVLIENKLRRVRQLRSVDEIAKVIKILVQLTCSYFNAPHDWHSPNFELLQTYLFPTEEEIDSRVRRSQLGEAPKYSVTLGVSTNQDDFDLQANGRGRISGKSIFGSVNMHAYLKVLCEEYDRTSSKESHSKMMHYKIPLDSKDRKPLSFYAKQNRTYFEKLVTDPVTEQSKPLVAGVSHSMARTLVTLQDLGLFNDEHGVFDSHKAKMIAHCFMGFISHGGHHSLSETGEVFNRLLDYIAIHNLEAASPLPNMNEDKLPYYRF